MLNFGLNLLGVLVVELVIVGIDFFGCSMGIIPNELFGLVEVLGFANLFLLGLVEIGQYRRKIMLFQGRVAVH